MKNAFSIRNNIELFSDHSAHHEYLFVTDNIILNVIIFMPTVQIYDKNPSLCKNETSQIHGEIISLNFKFC